MTLWYSQLQDIDYKIAELVLSKWVATNKWSPSIADIRTMVSEIKNGIAKTWEESWSDAMKAISYYGMYREDEALKSLDESTRKVVETIGYQNLCLSEKLSIERASFRDIYNSMTERKQANESLPKELNENIDKIGDDKWNVLDVKERQE